MSHTTTKTIARIDRLQNSASGNPRHRVIFTDGEYRDTEPDAQINYLITNSEYQDTPVEFMLNSRGHITHARPVGTEKRGGK